MAVNRTKTIEIAERYVQAGKLMEAVAEYKKLLVGDAQDFNIRNIIGDLYVRLGKRDNAREEFQKIANHYEDKGLYPQAIAIYKKINKLDPEDVELAVKLADLFGTYGFLSEAKREYMRVAKNIEKKGQIKEVIPVYEKLAKLDKEDFEVRMILAELYNKEGLEDQAVEELTAVAESKLKNDKLKEAEKILLQANKIKADHLGTITNLIELYKRKNKKKDAYSLLESALKKDQENLKLLNLLGALYFEDQNFKKAKEVFSQILKLREMDVEARVKLGRLHIQEDKLDEAYELYEPLIEGLIKKDKGEKAIGLLGLILASKQVHLPSLEKLAYIYETKDQKDKLETVYRVILEEYRERKLKGKMLSVLEKLVALAPKDKELAEQAKLLQQEPGIIEKKEEEEKIRAEEEKEKEEERKKKEEEEKKRAEAEEARKLEEEKKRKEEEEEAKKKEEEEKRKAEEEEKKAVAEEEERKLEQEKKRKAEEEEKRKLEEEKKAAEEEEEEERKLEEEKKRKEEEEEARKKDEEEKRKAEEEEKRKLEEEKKRAEEEEKRLEEEKKRKEEEEEARRREEEEKRRLEEEKRKELEEERKRERKEEEKKIEVRVEAPGVDGEDKEIIKMKLAKADLYLEQGLIRNARRILDDLKIRYSDEPRIDEKIAMLDEVRTRMEEDEIAKKLKEIETREVELETREMEKAEEIVEEIAASKVFAEAEEAPPAEEEEEEKKADYYDMEEKARDELDTIQAVVKHQESADTGTFERELSEIVSEFKKEVEEKVDKEDYEIHYNLGIAFMEQSLFDEAIEEFELASNDEKRALDCYNVMANCYKQKKDFKKGIKCIEKGLALAEEGSAPFFALKYELASIYEELEENEKALGLYNEIKEWNSEYRDVGDKTESLGK
ncbi:MAG: tetratricopeptide repeat protein [Candidatus Aminicenantes bacterium]|nr:tetratricopeptide repeat protein [Candidatus Aminicenantes bacterium]